MHGCLQLAVDDTDTICKAVTSTGCCLTPAWHSRRQLDHEALTGNTSSALQIKQQILHVVQLPSRLEVLSRLRAEKAEAAALREDPLGTAVDPQQESLARLQALRGQQQPNRLAASHHRSNSAEAPADGAAAGVGSQTAEAVAEQEAGAAADSQAAAAENEAGVAAVGDPYANMNSRQRKLYELKQKMQQARKANENAIVAERKRQRVSMCKRSSALFCCLLESLAGLLDNLTAKWHAPACVAALIAAICGCSRRPNH